MGAMTGCKSALFCLFSGKGFRHTVDNTVEFLTVQATQMPEAALPCALKDTAYYTWRSLHGSYGGGIGNLLVKICIAYPQHALQ